MNIKKKFNTRLARIREYGRNISRCDDIASSLMESEKNITAFIGPTDNDRIMACIKTYYTFVKTGNIVNVGDVHIITRYCPCFYDEHCAMYGCPYHNRNMKYKEQQSLLQQATNEKRASFRRMFQRIK